MSRVFSNFFEKSEDKSVPRERDQLIAAMGNLDADLIAKGIQYCDGPSDHVH
jgi:hypothetical protein